MWHHCHSCCQLQVMHVAALKEWCETCIGNYDQPMPLFPIPRLCAKCSLPSPQDTPETGLQWLDWMKHSGVEPDVVSYNAVLKQSQHTKDWQKSLQILEDMTRDQVAANIRTLNTVIDTCVQSGQRALAVQLALSLYEWHLEVDVLTCLSLIDAFHEYGGWQKALSLLFGMPQLELEANEFCFSSAMVSCRNSHQWQRAFHLFYSMQAFQLLPDAACYSAMIGACEESGTSWALALSLLRQMMRSQVAPNHSCFTSTLVCLKIPQEWSIAMELLSFMPQFGIIPNHIHWNAAMSTCATSDWQQALVLMNMMRDLGIHPDTDTVAIAMDAYQTASLWQTALNMFRSMPTLELFPGIRSYNSALNTLHQMECGFEIWSSALKEGVYPKLLNKGRNILDLHRLSRGAAQIALRWWLGEVVPELLESDPARYYLIITGHGKEHKEGSVISDTTRHLLDSLGLRFRLPNKKEKVEVQAQAAGEDFGAFSLTKKHLSAQTLRRQLKLPSLWRLWVKTVRVFTVAARAW
ncbi:unnamed protein product [Durusdinium trenchii]|uniref:Smr domain-containing protein n=1 Tax=Durusdinium trenchii TaxID=1381693 RepID=A0ABP0I5I9_9DINO